MSAFYLALLVPITPSSAATLSVGPGQPYSEIQDAVEDASNGDVISVDAGTYDDPISVEDIELLFVAQGDVVITGSNRSLFRVEDAVVDVTGFTFVPSGGRGIRASGATLTLNDITVRDNNTGDSPYNGAAMAVYDGSSVSVSNSTFTNNRTYDNFFGNISDGYGGHIVVRDGDLTIEDSTFVQASANRGGAIHLSDTSTLSVSRSTFTSLGASEEGGALYHEGTGSMLLEDCVFEGNSATGYGGAIWFGEQVSLQVTDSSFLQNSTEGLGGAIRWRGGDTPTSMNIARTSFVDNSAAEYGGAIAINTGSSLSLLDNVFERNSSLYGGAISAYLLEDLTAQSNTFCANTAGVEGGALRINDSGPGSWTNNVFYEHGSGDNGGGTIWLADSGRQSMVNNSILGSASSGDGGAIRLDSSSARLVNNLIAYVSDARAVSTSNGSTVDADYNAWFENLDGNIAGGIGPNSLDVDPAVLAFTADGLCNDDAHLQLASPLIDAGDPAISDPDGSPSDIGAFGGQSAPADLFVDSDNDGFAAAYDCDDTDGSIFPGATETCNGRDSNCDGIIDGPNATGAGTWFPDADQDGFGDTASPTAACEQPEGFTSEPGDCDDGNGDVNPSKDEICDGIDNDCDGTPDGANAIDQLTFFEDTDGDGFGSESMTITACEAPAGYVLAGGDCDDADSATNPSADEVCDDKDNDCNDLADDDAVDTITWYVDSDGDGFGAPDSLTEDACDRPDGFARTEDDCADDDATRFPGAPESCDPPLVDSNCDGITGDVDSDGDGFIACEDCDDLNPESYPGAPDALYDGVILDCNRTSDFDGDLDGFESDSYGGDDCDDTRADVNPNGIEIFGNDIDEDCDGVAGIDPFVDETLKVGCGGCAQRGTPAGLWWVPSLLVLALGRRRERSIR